MPPRRKGRGGGGGGDAPGPASKKLRSRSNPTAAAEEEEEEGGMMDVDGGDGSDNEDMVGGGEGEEPGDDAAGQDSDSSGDTAVTEEVVRQGSGLGGQGDAAATTTVRGGGGAVGPSSGKPQPGSRGVGAAAAAAKKKGKKSKNKKKKSSYPNEGLGDLGVVVDGIQDLVKGVGQCAKASLGADIGGGGEEADPDGTQREAILAQYRDIGMVLARTHEKLYTIPDAVRHVYEDLEIEDLATEDDGIGGDRQFLSVLEGFEKTAKEEAAKRCEAITVEQVEMNPMFQRFVGELDRHVADVDERNSRAARNKAATTQQQQQPRGGTARASSSRGRLPTTPRRGSSTQPGNSEDIDLLTEYIPTTDPITRKTLRDPVVNTCGHVYEYSSMVNMVITSKKLRCPFPGCSNREEIQIENLIRDPEMRRKIAEKIREERDG